MTPLVTHTSTYLYKYDRSCISLPLEILRSLLRSMLRRLHVHHLKVPGMGQLSPLPPLGFEYFRLPYMVGADLSQFSSVLVSFHADGLPLP